MKYAFIILFSIISLSLSADPLNLKIKDTSGEELVGACVDVDGKKYFSNLEGNVILDIPKTEYEIKVSYISFDSQTIKINGDESDIVVILGSSDKEFSNLVSLP